MLPQEPNPALDRVRHALRSKSWKPDFANAHRSGIHTRGYLPHVKHEGASYFVTFRLADSLPKEVLLKLQAARAERVQRLTVQRNALERGLTNKPPDDSEELIQRDYHREVEKYLDRGVGLCRLRDPQVAEIVGGLYNVFGVRSTSCMVW